MNNLILQHWQGRASAVEQASWSNIRAYAERIGAGYQLVTGWPVGATANPQMQKLCVFDAKYDAYDKVAMLDSDMFATPNAPSIFNVPGIGVMGPVQHGLRDTLHARWPSTFARFKRRGDFYGGAIYKFNRYERAQFRRQLTAAVITAFDSQEACMDEGAMHYLACAAGMIGHELPDGERWACSSFDPDVAQAHVIHVRRRIEAGKEDRRPKSTTLKQLQRAGLVAK